MIEKWPIYIESLGREMMLHVYLPDNYYETNERYPVIYMFDGHNLFHDVDATYGKSWGLEKFLDDYEKNMIVVGMECDHRGDNRLQEYMPYRKADTFFGEAYGNGEIFMDFVVNTLKPVIDTRYRTWKHREATAIGGSSMGGLMAFYGVIAYNSVFSKAACLSPTLFIAKEELKNEMHHHFINPDSRVYLSFGTKEVKGERNRRMILQQLRQTQIELEGRGASCLVNVVEGGEHCEASWETENPVYLNFLWK